MKQAAPIYFYELGEKSETIHYLLKKKAITGMAEVVITEFLREQLRDGRCA